MIEHLVKEKLDMPEIQGHIGSVKRLGKYRETRPMFLKFMTFSKKMEVLRKSRKLARIKIKVEQDYSREVRELRREFPCLKAARSRGHRAFM
jgi:hypothetical protein